MTADRRRPPRLATVNGYRSTCPNCGSFKEAGDRIAELMDSNLRMLNRIAELEADRDAWKQTAAERYFLSDPIHTDRFKTGLTA